MTRKMASRHRSTVKRRTVWLLIIFAVLYAAIVGRLVYVQILESATYVQWAREIRHREIPVPATRGRILDRAGRVLAVNVEAASIYADKREIKDQRRIAYQVAALLGKEPRAIESKLCGRNCFVYLGRNVDASVGERIAELKLPGVGRERSTRRVYPSGPLAAQVLGFTNIDNVGVEGIECTMDRILRGRDGLVRAELDNMRRVIPETRHVVREPANGADVYLTIDTNIQHIAEQALARMAKTYKPESACAIVLNPTNGEVLAIADYPTYDANKARQVDPELWRSRAVADLYEPGSTMKLVTVAAALEEGIPPHRAVAYCTGRERIKGASVPCVLHKPYLNGHGAVDAYQVIRHSCNIGAAHLGLWLGSDRLYKYQTAFGLHDRLRAGFWREARCLRTDPDAWRPIEIANISFGQGIAVTPLQMAAVYAAIANRGIYVTPHVVREARDSQGASITLHGAGKSRRAVSRATAEEITRMLVSCVEDGTGKTASIPGRTVAGKTGSAQIPNPNGRGYLPGAYVASFIGFAPAYKPRLVIAVVVKKPQGSHWGAVVAAPVFKEIGEKALWYLKVAPDAPIKVRPGDRRSTA
jgi:stage V sporulation protein D (sporulation-specific penicillin-binding protein)